jgi:ABC-type taurine transport system ATPase subunit
MTFNELQGIVARRPGPQAPRFTGLSIYKNDSIVLLGPSGPGKTSVPSVPVERFPTVSRHVPIEAEDIYPFLDAKQVNK